LQSIMAALELILQPLRIRSKNQPLGLEKTAVGGAY
jgi:hypothetical protein